MYFSSSLVGGLLLAGHASASLSNALLQPADDLEAVLRRDADLVASLTRRQNGNPVEPQISTTPSSADPTNANLAKWEADTEVACQKAMSGLGGQASNPSGLAVCYNLPYLDNSTGVFQAELRMYNISMPIDPWTGVNAANIEMTLSYDGATVQMMNGTGPMGKRSDVAYPPIRMRTEDGLLVEKRQMSTTTGVGEIKVIQYVGKVNPTLMIKDMTADTLQPILVPQIELSAKAANGQDLSATLSSQEASFVNGVFAKAATPAEATAAAASVSVAIQDLGVGAPFVVPGQTLAFFPIGLVITGTWAVLFFFFVGLGTYGRIQFRDQYRRRVRREVASNQRTI